jgi:hypothetical protein
MEAVFLTAFKEREETKMEPWMNRVTLRSTKSFTMAMSVMRDWPSFWSSWKDSPRQKENTSKKEEVWVEVKSSIESTGRSSTTRTGT